MTKGSGAKQSLQIQIVFPRWIITACILTMILLEECGYATCVSKTDLWVGDSATAACANEETSITLCHCRTVYFCAEAEVGAGTGSQNIVWTFDFDGDGKVDEWKFTNNLAAGTYTMGASHTYPDGDEYTAKMTVTRMLTACDTGNAECTVTAVEILSLETNPSGQYVACIDEDVQFKVTTSSGSDYDLISWSGGGDPETQNGGQYFTTNWDSESTGKQTVEATCESSCPETIDIEVIDSFTVLPHNAYVCTGNDKDFTAWKCINGEATNVSASTDFSVEDGGGTFTNYTLTAGETPSEDEGDYWVKGEYGTPVTDSDECELTVVKVEIAEFDRVPPGAQKGVQVTVSPDLTNASIGLEAKKMFGTSGSATVSPTSITSSTTVTVTGGDQTSEGDAGNISLIAVIDECGLQCECDAEPFTVCAHPINFDATACDVLSEHFETHWGLEVQHYKWDSDSGSTDHLNKCKLKEDFDEGYCNTPPFYDCGVPPEVDRTMSEGGGKTADEQGWPKADVRKHEGVYKAGEAGWDQRLYFKCERCTEEGDLSDNKTVFKVYYKTGYGWYIETEVDIGCDETLDCYNDELIEVE